MTSTKYGLGQLICGTGGALLIVSLFLPWAGGGAEDLSGWELWTMADVFLLITGLMAIAMALTGGRVGVFRPDLSLSAAADLLGLVATVLLAWLVIFDFPDGASREIGVFLALIGAIAVAAGAGDYAPLRGAPWFPKTTPEAGTRTK
jgi:hypothetical protein